LTSVVVTAYKVPAVKSDKTTQGGIRSAAQIRNLPVRNINSITALTAEHSSEKGDVRVRGSRTPAIEYCVDGIKVSESSASTAAKSSRIIRTRGESIADHSKRSNQFSAGQLTAGEINDFTKWVLWHDKSQQELAAYREEWNIYPSKRFMVIVQNTNGIPVTGQSMYLLDDKNNIVWTAKTDNTGKAELWCNMFEETYGDQDVLSIVTKMNDVEYRIHQAQRFEKGVNHLTIKSDCYVSEVVDAVFVVDATSSMSDEIRYLQEELTDVMQKVKDRNQDLALNLGCVFYRDHGDAYVTRTSELSDDISKTIHFVQNQTADGGGDAPEAVDEALEMAIRNMNWNANSRTKLLFVVMDASPHRNVENISRIKNITYEAALKGIKIIPLAASGITKSTEYLMRSLALCTNGTYVFLTDHSGIGNTHLQPTTDTYDVEKLNDLIIRLFDQYISAVSCNEGTEQKNELIAETRKIKSNDVSGSDTFHKRSVTRIEDETERIQCTFYPNPTTGLLHIDVKGKIEELFLCDSTGKLLQRVELDGKHKLQLDISPYPIGIYRIMYFEDLNVPRSGAVVLAK
jgi:hypothetical protein